MILRDFGYVQVGLTTPIWTPDKFVAFKSNHMQKKSISFPNSFFRYESLKNPAIQLVKTIFGHVMAHLITST